MNRLAELLTGTWMFAQRVMNFSPALSRWDCPGIRQLRTVDTGCQILLFVILGLFGRIVSSHAAPQSDRIEVLKSFLASPASVDGVIFRKRDLFQYGGAPRVDTNKYSIFFAMWQGGDFLIRSVDSIDELKGSETLTNALVMAHGKHGNQFWRLIGDNYVYWEDRTMEYSSERLPLESLPKDNDVLRTVSMIRGVLEPVMSMGIPRLKDGSLKWTGNAFTAEDIAGTILVGELVVEAGNPKEIRYRAIEDTTTMAIELEYPGSGEVALPTRLTSVFTHTNGLKTSFFEYSIDSIHFATSNIPVEAFSGKWLQVSGFTKILQKQGNSLYWERKNGPPMKVSSKAATTQKPAVFWVVILTCISPIAWLLLRAMKQRS